MKIRYIDNDPKKGILYDWKFLKREYKKLGVPKEYYFPLRVPWENAGYCQALSDRARGKTTEVLLLGMLMNKHYNTIVHYIRQDEKTIAPYSMRDLFSTIVDCRYIEKITDGLYNSAYYYGHKWYYCTIDENGKRVETAPEHFMICMCLQESNKRKSSYTCPRGDLIVFDEFIQIGGYGYSDFVRFADLVSTIFRKRLCGCVYMLSNTIDLNSPWFDEFAIRDDINTMQQGESRLIESPLGTKIFVEILKADNSEQSQQVNKRYFGFINPKLSAITGKGTWATETYPHIPPAVELDPITGERTDTEREIKIVYNKLFLRQSGKLLKLQLVMDERGLCVYCMPATRTYDDSYILTHGDITSPQEIFCFGQHGTPLEIFWKLYKRNLWYFATNADGALVSAYVKMCNQKLRKLSG